MKLTELFTSEKHITDTGKTQVNTARNDVVNRQIQSLIPGQTLQGEVVSRNGSDVQIRLADQLMLQARLDQNMNLEIGKNMTFEVKNNGKSLILSPLFTNMATDANVLKALDMASLPVNGTTVTMTKQLMEAGLSIDKNTLQQVYREVNVFSEARTGDIINLHKMQMPVNESNVTQMASYRNLTHQLVTGLNHVLDAIPDMLSQMVESGNGEGAGKIYQQLVLLSQEGNILPETMAGGNGQTVILPEGGMSPANLLSPENMLLSGNMITVENGTVLEGILPENGIVSENALAFENANIAENALASDASTVSGKTVISENPQGTVNAVIPESDLATGNKIPSETLQHTENFAGIQNEVAAEAVIRNHSGASDSGKFTLDNLLQNLKQLWTITPEEVADAEQVENLYRRLDKQLKSLAHTLEEAGQTSSNTYKAVTNMSQNLDFLQQVNQLYNYVQLPLRLQQGEAHGDLYVYTNKKHLASKDGQISALLHLDMEHLGPVDVYVSMMQENVNTKFYLQDDEMLDFINEHMDILTKRLQKRGYQCSYEMQVREEDEGAKSGIQKLLEQENHVPLSEYAFDVRT